MYLDAFFAKGGLFDVAKEQAIKYAMLKFSELHGLPTTDVLVKVFPKLLRI